MTLAARVLLSQKPWVFQIYDIKFKKTNLKKTFVLFCRERDEQGFAIKSFDEALSLLILHHQYQLFNVIEISNIIEMNHSDREAVYIVLPVTNNCCKLRKFTDVLNK